MIPFNFYFDHGIIYPLGNIKYIYFNNFSFPRSLVESQSLPNLNIFVFGFPISLAPALSLHYNWHDKRKRYLEPVPKALVSCFLYKFLFLSFLFFFTFCLFLTYHFICCIVRKKSFKIGQHLVPPKFTRCTHSNCYSN